MRVRKQFGAVGLLLLASLIVVSPLVFNRTAIMGVDTYFHYNRVYEAAMQLQHHNFSFLNLYSFQQAGRVVNQLYSPLLTYLFGGLLLVVGSWFRFQILSILILNFTAGLTMYWAARRLRFSRHTAVALGMMYLSSLSIYSFIFGTNWRAFALAWVPLLIEPMKNFYHGDWSFRAMVSLGLIIGVIAQAQMMTMLLALPVLIPFFVVGLFKSRHLGRSLGYLGAAILTALVLCFNLIMPFLDLVKTNTLLPPAQQKLTSGVTDFILPFSSSNAAISNFVVFIVFYLGIAGLIYYWRTTSLFTKLLLITALVYIVLGTNLMPWQTIQKSWPALSNFLQLPRRFGIIGVPLLLLGSVNLCQDVIGSDPQRPANKLVNFAAVCFALISVLSLTVAVQQATDQFDNASVSLAKGFQAQPGFINSHRYHGKKVTKVTQMQPILHAKNTALLIKVIDRTTPDYVPIKKFNRKTHYYSLYNKLIIKPKAKYHYTVKAGGKLQLTWYQTKAASKRGIPVVAYTNSQITLNGQRLTAAQLHKTTLGTLRLKTPAGKNTLTVTYQPHKLTTILTWTSVIAWLAGLIWLADRWRRSWQRAEKAPAH
ncbi:hypothetical protein LFAB_07740 [Lactiplantibacillus fabifermentans T30PCM01]|uniref:Cell division protein n=1 Tax=Lactiplantibacillus fabifermentans T30PCM01 TaxID=1400520 RepID=W6T914_9LACO|nr:hypothetical protein LFAB_07740 [Lactiplantibacillus fabifermentans T30PCM01]